MKYEIKPMQTVLRHARKYGKDGKDISNRISKSALSEWTKYRAVQYWKCKFVWGALVGRSPDSPNNLNETDHPSQLMVSMVNTYIKENIDSCVEVYLELLKIKYGEKRVQELWLNAETYQMLGFR